VVTTEKTKIVKRLYLLQWQVRNTFCRTMHCNEKIQEKIDKGLTNQWFRKVGFYGLDRTNRICVALELEINWLTYSIQILVWGETVSINKTVWAHEEVAPEVVNAIVVFNQAVNAECLSTEWRCWVSEGVDVDMVCRELGFRSNPLPPWAGKVEQQSSQVAELPELTVRLLFAESDALVSERESDSQTERSPEPEGNQPSPQESLESQLARLMQLFGRES
jgi:hypothetical protein